MNKFKEYSTTRMIAEALYQDGIDLQDYLDLIDADSMNEQQLHELMQTVGNALGQIGGAVTAGMKNFGQGLATGYQKWNPNMQQNQTNQQNQQNQQTAQQRQQAVTKIQQQLQQLQKFLPSFSQQVQTLAQMK